MRRRVHQSNRLFSGFAARRPRHPIRMRGPALGGRVLWRTTCGGTGAIRSDRAPYMWA